MGESGLDVAAVCGRIGRGGVISGRIVYASRRIGRCVLGGLLGGRIGRALRASYRIASYRIA